LFLLGKEKSPVTTFTNFDNILTCLHGQWRALRFKHQLVVGCKGYATTVRDDESLESLFAILCDKSNVELYVDANSQEFSHYANHRDEALARIKSTTMNMRKGVFHTDTTTDDGQYTEMTEIVWADLISCAASVCS
jgi:hypothetical protein